MTDPVLVTNPARPRDHGSGFVIRRLDGAGAQVVTCSHVVRSLGAEGLQVAGQPARVVVDLAADGIDLAVLAVPGLTEPPPVELGAGTVGDDVELLGFEPAGGGPLAVPHRGRLAKSSLTALAGRNRPAWHLELSDGVIEGGHSGGPVVDLRTRRVVGVIAMGPDQQGGKDGVAVAIENLRLWKDAPPIAPRAPREGSSTDSLIPELIRPPRRWWLVAGAAAVLAIGGAAYALRGRPSAAVAVPRDCGMPDLRDGFSTTAVADWCPDAVATTRACERGFPDGSTVFGTCAGTLAAGDWRGLDPRGVERWQAHFDVGSERPIGDWVERRLELSGAVFTLVLRHGQPVPDQPGLVRTSRTEEWRCKRPAGDSTVSSYAPDRSAGEREVTLSVPGGTFACSIRSVGGIDVPIECRRGLQRVRGDIAVDAFTSMLDAQRAIQNCQDAQLPALPQCGDNIINTGEECDDGGVSASCTKTCKRSACGDGVLNPMAGEQCEPGDTATCDKDCTVPRCNDGVLNTRAGEACDPAPAIGTKKCETNCRAPRCGDKLVNLAKGEQCDSGAVDSATCQRTCKKWVCGDGRVDTIAGEECDPGRTARSRGCTRDCKKQATVPLPVRPVTPTPPSP